MGKFTPDGYGYDVSEENKIFAREEHFCPYNKNATCSGWTCDNSCEIHPDYEDDYEDEDLEEAVDGVFQSGFNYGFKKGYKACIEEKDEELEPIDWQLEEEPHIPYDTEDIRFDFDYTDKELEKYETLFQLGKLEPNVARAYDIGKTYGYEQGMKELCIASEENYKEGYKACFLGEEPCIYDEDLEELLEQEGSFEDYETEREPIGFVVDGEIISGIESLKEEILDIKRKLNDGISMIPLVNKELYDLLHKLTVIQEKVSIDALHRHLGYK